MLALIASKLGLGNLSVQSDILTQQLNTELVLRLDIDMDALLEMQHPIEYLISERGFNDSNIETLALMMYQAVPDSEARNRFIKRAAAYLDKQGFFSFALHHITL